MTRPTSGLPPRSASAPQPSRSVPNGEVPGSGRWVGASVRRVEDPRLLTGRGRFTADLEATTRPLHVAFVRSPLAHAQVVGIDTAAAAAHPGAVAVLQASDLGLAPLVGVLERPEFVPTEMHPLARDRVRHVGEPVVVVVAVDRYVAEDVCELVEVAYDPLPPVVDVDSALAARGVLHDGVPLNTLLDVTLPPWPPSPDGSAPPPGAAGGGGVVVEAEIASGRTIALPLEGRACHAAWDARDETLVLHVSTQAPHVVRYAVASVLGLAEGRVRVIAPDVGGGFGMKCVVGREECVVASLARRLNRPVLWVEDRTEHLVGSFHAKEQRYRVRAAFDGDGRLGSLEADVVADVGAYSIYPFTCGVEPLMAASELPGVYRVGSYRVRTRAVATNKAPTAPYRGVSRPQIVLVMEHLMDKAARALGLDRAEIRRRNLPRPAEYPFTTATGLVVDAGSYLESLDRLEGMMERSRWPARVAAGRAAGRLVGTGLICFGERTAYGTEAFRWRKMAVTPGYDVSRVRMDATGSVVVTSGTSGHGQGHETTFAQIAADALGIPLSWVKIRQGDTDVAPHGWGTFASRSVVIGGSAVQRAAVAVADKLRSIAGHLLEADPADIELGDGRALVRGTRIGLDVAEIARVAHLQYHRLPEGMAPLLEETASYDPPGTFSNAAHGALVEIDPGTGKLTLLDYLVVEDCGVVINPMIVDGQVHGGVAQGIGAALFESIRYDPATGQPVTASLMDYLSPTAAEIPPMAVEHLCTPSAFSETGAKGMGEGGTIGAPAVVLCAVNDALRPHGVEVGAIPVRPEDVLRALAGTPGRTLGSSRSSV